MADNTYNKRLFSGVVRKRVHLARYYWLRNAVRQYSPEYRSVFELGCFDAKSLEFLPTTPTAYCGIDANWVKGLDIARERHASKDGFTFIESDSPDAIPTSERFDISICMETFEHIREAALPSYLDKVSTITETYSYVTVPNEIGLIVLLKYIYKLFKKEAQEYNFREALLASAGMTRKLERHQHKGFNYKEFIAQLSGYFEIVQVSLIPSSFYPFTVGIVCKKR